jgi:EmrB/QacA subfamily drug resistance transporter
MLSLASLILLGGGIGDQIGTLRTFRVGLMLFVLASVACGFALSVPMLVVARVVQGIGAAVLVPTSLALVSQAFTGEARGKAIGTWSAAGGVLLAFGPPLGGWLVDHAGWRSIFMINVPVGALALALSFAVSLKKPDDQRGKLDFIGSALAVLTLGLLTYGLIRLGKGVSVVGVVSLILALPMAVLFLVVEACTSNALVPLRLFRDRNFSGANALTIILYAGLSGALFLLPFLLIKVHGYSPTAAGMAFVPFSVILGIGSRFSGGLAATTGPRLPLIAGPLVTAAGFATLALSGQSPSYLIGFFPGLVLIGLGMTLAIPALTTTVFDSAPDADSGAASGINNAAARTGGLLAVAALGIAFGKSDLATLGNDGLSSAYRTVMLFSAAAAVLSAICAATMITAKKEA